MSPQFAQQSVAGYSASSAPQTSCAAAVAGRKLLQSVINPTPGAVLAPAVPALASYMTTTTSDHPYLSWYSALHATALQSHHRESIDTLYL